jgi:hypothetical protein
MQVSFFAITTQWQLPIPLEFIYAVGAPVILILFRNLKLENIFKN